MSIKFRTRAHTATSDASRYNCVDGMGMLGCHMGQVNDEEREKISSQWLSSFWWN